MIENISSMIENISSDTMCDVEMLCKFYSDIMVLMLLRSHDVMLNLVESESATWEGI